MKEVLIEAYFLQIFSTKYYVEKRKVKQQTGLGLTVCVTNRDPPPIRS